MQTPCSSGAEHTVNKNIIVPLGCLPSEVPANCPFPQTCSLWRGFLVLKTRNIYRQHNIIIYTHYTTHYTFTLVHATLWYAHNTSRGVCTPPPTHVLLEVDGALVEVNRALVDGALVEVDGALVEVNRALVDGALVEVDRALVDGALTEVDRALVNGALVDGALVEVDGALVDTDKYA